MVEAVLATLGVLDGLRSSGKETNESSSSQLSPSPSPQSLCSYTSSVEANQSADSGGFQRDSRFGQWRSLGVGLRSRHLPPLNDNVRPHKSLSSLNQ